jgi:hypothetical protein
MLRMKFARKLINDFEQAGLAEVLILGPGFRRVGVHLDMVAEFGQSILSRINRQELSPNLGDGRGQAAAV